jgi:hypothetical protein
MHTAGGPFARIRRGKEADMLDNATYNLMETASHISKGLHRYEATKHPEDAAIDLAALARLN